MRNPTLRAVIMGLGVLVLITGTAHAGTILLTRESAIRASGTAGSADFNLSDGSHDFDGFADAVDSADSGVVGPRVAANQHSRPAMDDFDGFTGAYAEGSATAALEGAGAGADNAQAVSNFDLTFQVLGVPSVVDFGGSVGVTGNGSTSVALSNETTGEILLSQELLAGDGEGQSIQHSTVLQPGVYELSVAALVNGEPSESMAYYTVSLSISALADGGGGGATPIPLPPAIWSAAGLLVAGGAARGCRKLRGLRRGSN